MKLWGRFVVKLKVKLTIVATVSERTECDYLDDHFNNKNIERDIVDELRDAFKLGTLVARLQQHDKSVRKNHATDKQLEIIVMNYPMKSVPQFVLGRWSLKLQRGHKPAGLNPAFLPRC